MFVLKLFLCVLCTCLVNALSPEDEAEIRELCCNHGETLSVTSSSVKECAEGEVPEEIESDQLVACKASILSCCQVQFQEKDHCKAGMKDAKSKRCNNPTTEIGKTCCEECSFGRLTGESQGESACGGPSGSDVSHVTALRRNAYYECCLDAAKKPTTTTEKKVETTTLPPKPKETCAKSGCDHYCDDSGGVVRCSCKEGFRLQPDKKSCVDINECIEALDDLCTVENTVCHNVPGAFKCVPIKKRDVGLSCPPGFQRNVVNQVCDDINECQLPRPPCPKYLCENTIGGYKCGGKPGKPFEEAVPGVPGATEATAAEPAPKSDICPPGFRDGADEECFDIDECVENLDDCQRLSQHCINTHGGFFCQDHVSKRCSPGFKVNSATGICEDIDECEESSEVCQRSEVCINLPGAYNCKSKISQLPKLHREICQEGTRMKPGGKVCEDIDECREGTHLCDQFQNCINTYGAHECRCKHGFELDSATGSCADIDECALKLDNCGPGLNCLNVLGSFTCTRRPVSSSTTTMAVPGYEYEYYDSNEEYNTTDPEEPDTTKPISKPTPRPIPRPTTRPTPRPTTRPTTRATTTTTTPKPTTTPRPTIPPRSYYTPPTRPTSRPPYTPIRTSTSPKPTTPTRPEPAVPEPSSTPESPNRPESPTEVNDVEKPAETSAVPDIHSVRPETPKPEDRRPYRPYDPYRPRYDPNRPYDPYRPNTQNRPRPDYSRRLDTRRSTTSRPVTVPTTTEKAKEDDPFNPDEVHCLDGLEKDADGNCVEKTTNVIKPFDPIDVRCRTGYEPDINGNCIDVDECSSNRYVCGSLEKCVNNLGGYTCECIAGFTRGPDGWCMVSTTSSTSTTTERPTTEKATTQSTTSVATSPEWGFKPSYNTPTPSASRGNRVYPPLMCELGYRFDPTLQRCVDVDECAMNKDTCSAEEDCVNMDGGFKCVCGSRCRAVSDKPTYEAVLPPRLPIDSSNVITVGSQFGQRGPWSPRPSYSRDHHLGSIMYSCPWGYKLTSDQRCFDIDECAKNSSECGPKQRCENFYGGYSCQCPAGHRLVGRNDCEDIDECVHGNPCSYNARCINTIGSYRCECSEGFRNAPSNDKVCVDVDECSEIPNVCHHSCANAWGGYRCYCQRGYRLGSDNRTCADVNECEEWSSVRIRGKLCGGECVNEPGSYRCSCPSGYRLADDQRSCVDIDECESGEASCAHSPDPGHVCQNTRGGYHCHRIECPDGYRLEAKHRCSRIQRSCPISDWSCLQKPSSYSYNFITFVANIYLPSGSVDLFTMHGPSWSDSVVSFEMRMVNVQAAPGVQPADLRCFDMRPSGNVCAISLLCPLAGPQVAELELTMSLYQRRQFAGSAVARLIIIVSQYEY